MSVVRLWVYECCKMVGRGVGVPDISCYDI